MRLHSNAARRAQDFSHANFRSPTVEYARRLPIVEELERRGHHLKRYGRELVGPCPVCGGTDRFAVNVPMNIWNCRGCSKGGDVISLVQHIDQLPFSAAMRLLVGNEPRQRIVVDQPENKPDTNTSTACSGDLE
jgi:DNA primase